MELKYDDLIGIPFRDGGRDMTGLDCWGLVRIIYDRIGIDLPDYHIAAANEPAVNAKMMDQEAQWQRLDHPEMGAVVLIANGACGRANHVGVYIGDGRMIHAYAYSGVAISHTRRWAAHIIGYYKPRKENVN